MVMVPTFLISCSSLSLTLNEAWIYDVLLGTWREGPPLPHALRGGLAVPYGDTFLITGGFASSNAFEADDRILEFDPEAEQWTVREETLQVARQGHYAAVVGRGKVDCI